MTENALKTMLDSKGFVVLDGGLSAELEQLGYDLDHPLWTARLLEERPDAIRQAHLRNLEAGADCIISSSYQASIRGLCDSGYTHNRAVEIIETSYQVAQDACDEFFEDRSANAGRTKPIVAASIGPYGAYLADGSEYRGDYRLSRDELLAFHHERFDILSARAQLLAIETIPSYQETLAIRELVAQTDTAVWFSFSCKDGEHINDGHPIEDAAQAVATLPQVIAVGVNCTEPKYVSSLIKRIKTCCGTKEIVVYPNSGEHYCSDMKCWTPAAPSYGIADLASEWYSLGARIIGGCCRTTATDIKDICSSFDATTAL